MRDPFKQNTQSQLIREAQFAFIVIGLLLCVLVYVAFHRVSGRKFHFRQIAQSAPVAQQVDGVAYPAQAIIEHESKAIPQAFSGIQEMAQPKQMPVKQIPVKQRYQRFRFQLRSYQRHQRILSKHSPLEIRSR